MLQSAASGAGWSREHVPRLPAERYGREPAAADVISPWPQPQPLARCLLVHGFRAPNPGKSALDRFICMCVASRSCLRAEPYILSSNHQSYIDPVPFWRAFCRQRCSTRSSQWETAKYFFFGKGFMLWLARCVRVVVVDTTPNLIFRHARRRFRPAAGRPVSIPKVSTKMVFQERRRYFVDSRAVRNCAFSN